MMLSGVTLLQLSLAALLPVAVAVIFYLAEKKTRFGKINEIWQQLAVGVAFGIVAVLATEYGVPYDGYVMNVRNAAPLTAGLLFGWPAGLLSGLIGGVQRWFSDAGDFTRMACSLATMIAGVFGAAVRRFLMDNKKASWLYALIVGITSEVLHMLLVFLTNASEIRRAFAAVEICALPMIIATGFSVMLATIVITMMGKGNVRGAMQWEKNGQENIAQTFQRWLLICVVLAFACTWIFTHAFQTQVSYAEVDHNLRVAVEDVENDIRDISDRNMLALAQLLTRVVPANATQWDLLRMAIQYEVTEINLVDENGIITVSTNSSYVNYDMASGAQSAEFLVLLDGAKEYVQEYQATTLNPDVFRKYVGVALEDGGFLQLGYDAVKFQANIDEQVVYIAENRHIGQTGYVIVCNELGRVVSDPKGYSNENISLLENGITAAPMTRFLTEINGEETFCMYNKAEGYYIVAVQSCEEAMFAQKASVYMLAFMETLVFVALFANIFVLIKRLVVQNIRKINESLSRITDGDLNVKVNVRNNAEFASLSDDINSTVDTLRSYIAEAEARFDKDLEIAKTIQKSSLPTVFPPYPNRRDFSIFASMDAAKEVGGDFYDFYLLDDDRLAFVVADVSGKGIPGAMFMMTSKTLIKGHAESGLTVDEVFTQVNTQLCQNNDAGMFVTAWMGILDLKTGMVRYANAGHNPPAVRHKDGSYEYIKGKVNFVLAGMEGVRYREQQLQLQPGDTIYLYTDGVTEAHNANKELFGEAALLNSLDAAAALSVEEICKHVKDDVNAFAGGEEQFDDITMLCVRLNETDSKTLSTQPTLDSVSEVSAFVEEQLERIEVPMKLTMKLMVALDEIYSNIVRYSGATEAQICVAKEEQSLKLTFVDNGKPYNPLEAKEPDITASAEDRAIGGLGIFMVRKMMDKVEYMYKEGCNILTLIVGL